MGSKERGRAHHAFGRCSVHSQSGDDAAGKLAIPVGKIDLVRRLEHLRTSGFSNSWLVLSESRPRIRYAPVWVCRTK